jgi:hypothetical protein
MGERTGSGKIFLATAVVFFAVNLAIRFPGTLTPDSRNQLAQAIVGQFTDWHPPIMAVLWSALLPLIPGPASLLILHVGALWFGLACVGDALRRIGRPHTGFAVLVSGLSPVILYYSGIIIKDVGVASMCIAAFGAIFWFQSQERKVPWWVMIFVLAFLLYATFVRANAVFATPPLLVYAAGRVSKLRHLFLLAAALTLAMVPASGLVNRALAPNGQTGIRQSIQVYDLVGIAFHSGDLSILPTRMSREQLRKCYTPLFWDTIAEEVCERTWQRLPPPGSAERNAIASLWLASIGAHPVAYAKHRLRHFNASLQFLVPPAQHCRFFPAMHDCGEVTPRPDGRGFDFSSRLLAMDYVKKNPLVWPIVWIALGIGVFAGACWLPRSPQTYGGLVLAASGLLYGFGYFLVGLAADPRYYLWTILAVQSTALILGPELARSNPRSLRVTAVALGVILVAGYIFRIGDIGAFVTIS